MKIFLDMMGSIFKFFMPFLYVLFICFVVFFLLCGFWLVYYHMKGKRLPKHNYGRIREYSILRKLFIEVPRRFILDKYNKEPNYFEHCGIHMFCGEQGSGKTISAVQMILKLQKRYPLAKTITNFGLTTENDTLEKWQQLLDYNNGKLGVIVGIDEIQNWFMSGLNKLPEGMLEIVTQNRKNRRILCCTSQVLTRTNKAIREQATLIYNPHTFLGCFTIVVKRKPEFDSEGNIINQKYRGMYCFVHTEELRKAYDTYKAIHMLSKEGFKDNVAIPTVNNYYMR